jgi:hypothetical protein
MGFSDFWEKNGMAFCIVVIILLALVFSMATAALIGVSPISLSVATTPVAPPSPDGVQQNMRNRGRGRGRKSRYSGGNASIYDMQAAALTSGGSIADSINCSVPGTPSETLWNQLNRSLLGETTEDGFLTAASAADPDVTGGLSVDASANTSMDGGAATNPYLAANQYATWQTLLSQPSSASSLSAQGSSSNASAAFTNQRRRR